MLSKPLKRGSKLSLQFLSQCGLFALLTTSNCVFGLTCHDLSNSPSISKINQFLLKEAKVQSTWGTYRLSDFPVILMDSSISSNCIVILEKTQIRKSFQTSRAIKLEENPIFSFINPWKLENSSDLVNLAPLLKTENIRYGILLDVGSPDLVDMLSIPSVNGVSNPYYELFGKRKVLWSLYILTHESFHALVQTNELGINWPQQRNGMRRDNTLKCYSDNPQLASIVEREKSSLLSMLKRSLIGHQVISKKDTDFQEFVAARDKRYVVIGKTSFENDLPDGGCTISEAEWEWAEGVPDYYAFSTLVNTDYFSETDLFTYKNKISTHLDLYYFFGSSMLQILKNQKPEAVSSMINSIGGNQFSTSIYELFKSKID